MEERPRHDCLPSFGSWPRCSLRCSARHASGRASSGGRHGLVRERGRGVSSFRWLPQCADAPTPNCLTSAGEPPPSKKRFAGEGLR